jgi:galactoside O-acetyltransferase
MKNSFYSIDELLKIGFKSFGTNVLISRYACFYGAENMEFGNNVRIDDFCVLSGNIKLGNFIHISAYNALYGKYGIVLEDFTGISPRCTVFSASDDFSGDYLIGPMVDHTLTNVIGGKVILKKYSQLGGSCVVLPNVTINTGAVVGTMSLVNRDLDEWKIYKGIPAKYYKDRSKGLLDIVSLIV